MSALESDVDTLRHYAREIHKESQALSKMITDFLNFARPAMTSMNEVNLTKLLENTVSDLKHLRPGKYAIKMKASCSAVVACDPTLIRQSFLNLLINAVEALDGEGSVFLGIDILKDRNQVRIVVEDNGHGIPADIVPKIFIPFFTTKTHGTGLGLSLVQKIVLAHNGRIEVQSAEGKGARFIVTLPCGQGVAQLSSAASAVTS